MTKDLGIIDAAAGITLKKHQSLTTEEQQQLSQVFLDEFQSILLGQFPEAFNAFALILHILPREVKEVGKTQCTPLPLEKVYENFLTIPKKHWKIFVKFMTLSCLFTFGEVNEQNYKAFQKAIGERVYHPPSKMPEKAKEFAEGEFFQMMMEKNQTLSYGLQMLLLAYYVVDPLTFEPQAYGVRSGLCSIVAPDEELEAPKDAQLIYRLLHTVLQRQLKKGEKMISRVSYFNDCEELILSIAAPYNIEKGEGFTPSKKITDKPGSIEELPSDPEAS